MVPDVLDRQWGIKEKKIKDTSVGEQETKCSLFTNDTIIWAENLSASADKLLELMGGKSLQNVAR